MSRRSLVIGVVYLLLLHLTSACAEPPVSSGNATKSKETAPVTLKIMIPGNPSPDFDLVIDEAERRMEADSLGIKLDFQLLPWDDFGRKTQVALASGEEIDLVFDAPWLHLNEMIAKGYYEPLDVLLDKYGAEILSTRPKKMWEANRFGGQIMAIPLGVSHVMGHSYMVRKDIREKLGVPPIQSYEDLIRFAYLVKDKEPDLIPLTAAGTASQQLYNWSSFRHYDELETNIRPTHALGSSLMLHYKNNDGVVHNLFEEKDSLIREWVKGARQLYLDGLMNPNVLGIKDFQNTDILSKAAIYPIGSFTVGDTRQEVLQARVPHGELENATFFRAEPGRKISNFSQWNFIAVPVASENKEAAIRFLDWASQKENYELLAFGIEGVHWERTGEEQYNTIGKGAPMAPFVWIWNPEHDLLLKGKPEEEELERFIRDENNFQPDILTGFQFDMIPVQNEMKQYLLIEGQFYLPLFNGVVDPDTTWERFESEAGELLLIIQQELQRQIEQFLGSKRKPTR